jgi:hypothetical protein
VLDELDRRLLPTLLLPALERFKLAIYETVDEEVVGSAVVAGDGLRGIVAVALARSRVAGVSACAEVMRRFAASPEAEYLCGAHAHPGRREGALHPPQPEFHRVDP